MPRLNCWLLAALLMVGSAGFARAADEKGDKPKEVKVASIVIRGPLAESAGQAGLFGEISEDLRKTIERLDKAAGDKAIGGVVLHLQNASLGRGRIDELRAAIRRTRDAGKKVFAHLDSAETANYLVASACDQIIMPSSGVLMLPGVRAEVTYYKRLLDTLGVQADFLHVGAYKGAAEPFTRENMSEEVRQNLTAVIDDFYRQMLSSIAADRKLSEEKVKELVDEGLFTVDQAREAGLIDAVAYEDQLEELLRKTLDAEKLATVKGYGKKKVDTDFSGPMGMFKLMQMMMGVEPGSSVSKQKKIAVIYAVGSIIDGKSVDSLFGGQSIGNETIVKALRKAEKNPNVVAIVLRVDSPGGSALASDLMWREITRIEKPIVASMGDVAASGGYYISMGADKIFAEPGTLTGSIGVVGGKLATEQAFAKLGVTSDVISRGQNAGLFDSSGRFSDSQRKVYTKMLDEIYRQFTTKAAEGRKMDVAKLQKLAAGQVWTGRMAKENGLVDELGTLRDAINEAKKLAGLEADAKVELLILPEPVSILDALFTDPDEEGLRLAAPAAQSIGGSLKNVAPELARPLAQVEMLRRIFRHPAAMLMPFELEVR